MVYKKTNVYNIRTNIIQTLLFLPIELIKIKIIKENTKNINRVIITL